MRRRNKQSQSHGSQEDGAPVVEELKPMPDAEAVFQRLCDLPHCLYLDSALHHEQLGRYSFIAVDPFDFLTNTAEEHLYVSGQQEPAGDGFSDLANKLSDFQTETIPDLPPFQGGAAGLMGYGLARQLEYLPATHYCEFDTPPLAMGLYDVVISLDHQQQRAWIVSQGFPEVEPAKRQRRAQERIDQVKRWLGRPFASIRRARVQAASDPISPNDLAPQHAAGQLPELTSTFSHNTYLAAVSKVVDYIHAGDAFQVNLAQRLLYPARDDSVDLYLRLRRCNPATFAGYFDLGAYQIVSASPERFLKVCDRQVETRPIKGTRQRTSRAEADLFAGDDLKQSEKDRAENVMIVDLLRNDLSRVCRPESVRVTQLCELESYQYVKHLVSAVVGELRDDASAIDLLRAAFPGGSITGAPKVRAMQIIAELEPTARGPYCGSLGYVGFDESVDTSILIRTITAGRGWWQVPVGGGIVAASNPQREYEETWHKAEGMLRAMQKS